MDRKGRWVFTQEQKLEMLKDIETFSAVQEGLEKYQLCHSGYKKIFCDNDSEFNSQIPGLWP